jgi:hypothetical protein
VSPRSSATVAPDAIDHPTGASDVVLRVGERGGYVLINHIMARVPLFTLYGDGLVLLVPADTFREPGAPVREVRLNEEGIQAVLARAIVDGGLGIAPPQIGQGLVMDLPETVFEVHAGGVDKSVVAGLLTAEPPPGPDAAAIRTLDALLTDLRSIPTSADYAPPAFMAVIAESEPDPAQVASAWPWADLPPAEFAQPPEDATVPFPSHLLTADELAALEGSLGSPVGAGGVTGLRFEGPDGKPYLIEVRPALPDELASG